MRKKIKLLVIFFVLFLTILVLTALGFFYFKKTSNSPVAVPVTQTPKSLLLTNELKSNGFLVAGTPFESKGVIQASVSGTVVLFSSSKNIKTQVKALQLLEARIKMETQKPREIDLRFDKVVLRY